MIMGELIRKCPNEDQGVELVKRPIRCEECIRHSYKYFRRSEQQPDTLLCDFIFR